MKVTSRRTRHLLFLSLFGLGLLQLGGCTLIPEEKPLRMFILPMDAAGDQSSEVTALPVRLRVHSLQAGGMLASPRIVVVPQKNEMTVYGGVRWTEPAPVLLRDRLVEAFKRDGRLEAVFNDTARLQSTVDLSGVLNVFQSEYTADKVQVRIQADFNITDPAGREILASRRFEITEESEGERIEEVVSGFGRAGDRLSQQVLAWALGEMAAL